MTASTTDSAKWAALNSNIGSGVVGNPAAIEAALDDIRGVVDQHATEINLKANRTQESWTAPTLINGWVNFSGATIAEYYKDSLGVVRLRGTIKSGAIGIPAFTLPVGYRPTTPGHFAVSSNDLFGKVFVSTGGAVHVDVGDITWVDLSSVSFRADQ